MAPVMDTGQGIPACGMSEGVADSFGAPVDTESRVLRLPPMRVLFTALAVGLAGFGGSLWLVLQQPWLGVGLQPAPDGVRVAMVDRNGAAADILSPGDRLVAIAAPGGRWMQVAAGDLIADPDEHRSFSDYNAFLERQDRLSRILRSAVVRLRLGDGREVRVQPRTRAPVYALSGRFWMCQGFAVLTLMISTAIWSLRRKPLETRLLLLSGIGLFVGATSASLYLGREIAIDGGLFRWLSTVNFRGNRLFAVAGLALLCSYPRRVAPVSWVGMLAILEGSYLVNLVVQWLEPPVHAYYLDFVLLAGLAVLVSARAWWLSRGQPVDRATLKVLLLPILLSVALVMGIYVVPTIVSGAPLMDVAGSYMLLLIMYAGLAFGVARFRLFNIERWWIRTWLWFLLGLAIMGLDLVIITVLRWTPGMSLVVSLLVVSWLYFPLRQWAWERLLHRRSAPMEHYVSKLVAHFVHPGSMGEDMKFWAGLMQEAFLPASMEVVDSAGERVALAHDGIRMRVPAFEPKKALEMRLPDRGGRLFDEEDAQLAQALFDLAVRARAQREAYQMGMEDERRRIMRDLHDDVGGRLLSLVHASGEGTTRRLAQEALDSLRDVIYFTMEGGTAIPMGDLLGRWRAQLRQRLKQAGVQLEWSWDEACESLVLKARDALSLGRILYEGTSNALRHASPRRIAIEGRCGENALCVTTVNDGVLAPSEKMRHLGPGGHGLHNIRKRAEEMGGRAEFVREGDRFMVCLSFPKEAIHVHESDD